MVKESSLAQFHGKSQNYTDIPNKQCREYNIKKGLKNEDGTGMRIGLTGVADVMGYEEADGGVKTIPGRPLYRGVNVLNLVKGKKENHLGYGETYFLLLFGYLPKKAELEKFCSTARHCYVIPGDFIEMNLLRFPGKNLMNKLQDTVLTLHNYDSDPDNTDVYQTLVKGVSLLAKPPSIACYTYQSKVYYYNRENLFIYYVDPEYSIAENSLSLLRKSQKFTPKEANLLDTTLMLHADHDGGNNSTFTNVAIVLIGTSVYLMACGGIGSLKGPCHGGASIEVAKMMDAVLAETGGCDADDKKIRQSVEKLMAGEPYDRSGLAYDFGHAVYMVSNPHMEVSKVCRMEMAKEQKYIKELDFHIRFECTAKEVMGEIKDRAPPTNVDFYSRFAYGMLRIPRDLYTPLLVCGRAVGWAVHSIESRLYDGRIMHLVAKYIDDNIDYVPMPER